MKKIFYINRLLLLAALAMLFSACAKKYKYDFKNGYSSPEANDSIPLDKDTSRFHVDRSKIGEARLFPGIVSDTEPRLQDYKVNLDIDYHQKARNKLRISVLPQPWFGTGLYAPAGELIEIDVPDGIYGLEAQIGVWTDNDAGKDQQLRDPLIVNKIALFPGKNYIRNLYGGPLIVIASRSLGKKVALNISGAVKSPNFVLGETTNAEWHDMIAHSSVPWFELVGKRIVFDLPTSKLHTFPIQNPTLLMKTWDSVIVEDYNKWYGLSDHPSDPRNQAPQLPWRVVQDIQPSAGYAHNGYPVVAKLDDHWFVQFVSESYIHAANEWGLLHELGHNFQMGSTWKWSDLGEVSNNLHVFHLAHRLGFKQDKMSSSDFSSALSWAAEEDPDKKFSDLNVTERLVIFVQVFEYYGYNFQTYLTTEARHETHTALNDQIKIDFYYEKLSEFTGHDMLPFMNHWGLYPSTLAQSTIQDEGLPAMRYEAWKFNPWTGEGGKSGIMTVGRSDWKVVEEVGTAADNGWTMPEGGTSKYQASNLFDDDMDTFWNTVYNNPNTDYPYSVTVDMTEDQPVSGFYFKHREPAGIYDQAPRIVNIYIGEDPNNLTEVVADAELPKEDGKLKVDLPENTAPFRYFKVEFTSGWSSGDPNANHEGRVMDLAELGVY